MSQLIFVLTIFPGTPAIMTFDSENTLFISDLAAITLSLAT